MTLLHQTRQTELTVGSAGWLLAVIGAVAAQPPQAMGKLARRERRAFLEEQLHASGLGYGAGAVDPAVELDPMATPGARAFAHFVAGLVRLCASAGALAEARYFVRNAGARDPAGADEHAAASSREPSASSGRGARSQKDVPPDLAVQARRAQLLAVLAAASGEARAAAPLFVDPLGDPARQARLAGRVAPRLARRYLAERGPFAGLPLHNGLCAIEARTCATLALAAFGHGRISPAAAAFAQPAALRWRSLLVELLAGLSRAQQSGKDSLEGMDHVLRSQRLPPREARLLRRSLLQPRELEALAPALHSAALRKFALTQVLLGALLDRNFEAGEVAYVERLSAAVGASGGELAALEVEVDDFYRRNRDALAALQLAATREGLPHALTTRLEAAVRDNLDRILQEIRETGELAELLAKASVGNALSAPEKAKVREQLIDLAKTIPALAIFAAPGGMLLLPILIKLLPFNLLPSSFVDPPPARPALPEPRRRSGS